MNLDAILDWGLLAISFFNTILLFWLGLTVLLHAEKPVPGAWLAGCGLLLGGVFFAVHGASLDYSLDSLAQGSQMWWFALLGPVIVLPLGWYGLMLWCAGRWDALSRRQTVGFGLACALFALSFALLVLAYPHLSGAGGLYGDNPWTAGGVRALMIVFPAYLVVCTSFSLDALRHPAPTGRLMSDLARQRARPYLIGSSLVQLGVSALITGALLMIARGAQTRNLPEIYSDWGVILDWANLVVATLIGVAVVLLGKAIVSYEIFTGKMLPRRAFLRQWRGFVSGAMAYSSALGWLAMQPWRPIYNALFPTIALGAFAAILSWRDGREREKSMAGLRPIVASQHLFEHLTTVDGSLRTQSVSDGPLVSQPVAHALGSQAFGTEGVFETLCRDVLGASVAYLSASGTLSPLIETPLCFGDSADERFLERAAPSEDLPDPNAMCMAVSPGLHGGARWAVPLWSARGIIGTLWLGDKSDGGLYTLEEIEVARMGGERLLDARAASVLAGRLMTLQRQKLSETLVVDRRARRVLHDDILPLLHAAMLAVSGEAGAPEALELLARAHGEISGLLREMPASGAPEVARHGLMEALKRVVESELDGAFETVAWNIEPRAATEAARLPTLPGEVMFYAARETLRNSARHAGGRGGKGEGETKEKGRPCLKVCLVWSDGLELLVCDNGPGLAGATRPSGAGGAGRGLALHSTMMAVIGGQLSTQNAPEGGLCARVFLPQSALAAWE